MRTRNVTTASLAITTALFLVLARPVMAANYYWINASGGYFDDGQNWSLTEGGVAVGTMPGATDSVIFPASSFPAGGNYTVRITNSPTTVATSSHDFPLPSGKRLSVDLAPGACWTLLPLGADSYIYFPGQSSTVEVTGGGTWMMGRHLQLASSATSHDLTLAVSGEGTVVSNQNWDMWIGKNGYNNQLVVTNGGYVLSSRGVYIGGDAVSASNNTAWISGTNSTVYALGVENNSLAGAIAIGRDGPDNTVTVSDGGAVFAKGGLNNYSLYLGRNATAQRNTLYVLSGGLFVASNNVAVGVDGSFCTLRIDGGVFSNEASTVFHVGSSNADSNRLEISNGGLLSVWGHVRLGNSSNSTHNVAVVSDPNTRVLTTSYDVSVGTQGDHNTMIVTNGAWVNPKRSIYVGGEPDSATGWASFNTLLVTGSGSVVSNSGGNGDGIYIGKRGQGNRLVVTDGGSVSASFLYVGGMGNSSIGGFNTSLEATDGAIAARGHFYIGYTADASNNVVRLVRSTYTSSQYDLDVGRLGSDNLVSLEDGSSMTIPRSTYIGHYDGASNNVLSVEDSTFHGDQYQYCVVNNGGRIRVLGDSNTVFVGNLILTNATSALEFRLNTTNFTPIAVNYKAYLRDETKVMVDARNLRQAGVIGSVSVPLLSAGELLSADLGTMTVETQPVGCTVEVVGKKLVLTKVPGPPGTTVLIQ